MTDNTPAQIKFEALKQEANAMDRPEQRLQTLERLKLACDEISSGLGHKLIKGAVQINPQYQQILSKFWITQTVKLIPKRIEEYVNARNLLENRQHGHSEWSGPKSSTIRQDSNGMAKYVKLRASEQLLPIRQKPKKKRSIDQYLEQIDDMDGMIEVQTLIEEGIAAKNELQLLKHGLTNLDPGFDINKLLFPLLKEGQVLTESTSSDQAVLELSRDEKMILRKLVDNFSSNDFLSLFGLKTDTIRISETSTNKVLVSKKELELLKKLVKKYE